jgi:hypothetical protein
MTNLKQKILICTYIIFSNDIATISWNSLTRSHPEFNIQRPGGDDTLVVGVCQQSYAIHQQAGSLPHSVALTVSLKTAE